MAGSSLAMCQELGPKGLQNGSGFEQRIQKQDRNIDESWSETTLFGALNTKEVIERMVVCDGQPQRGWRKSMFSSEFKICGLSTAAHSGFQTMIQIGYANKLLKEGD